MCVMTFAISFHGSAFTEHGCTVNYYFVSIVVNGWTMPGLEHFSIWSQLPPTVLQQQVLFLLPIQNEFVA